MFDTIYPSGASRNPQPVQFNDATDLLGAYALPPVGRVFFVRGDGTTVTNLDDQYTQFSTTLARKLYPSVVTALSDTKASRADTIVVLPGHTENIATADAWAFKVGVRIMGIGTGTLIPTFTFTAAAATLVLDSANVSISGCRFLCAGPAGTTALTVAAPFTLSAAGCGLQGCQFEVGIDADQRITTFATISAANCWFRGNRIESQSAASIAVAGILLTAANYCQITDNEVRMAVGGANRATTTAGIITSDTTASTNLYIARNRLHNTLASSTGNLNFNAALACTGIVEWNLLCIEDATAVTALVMNAANDLRLNQNFVQNEKNKTAIQIGTAVD